MKEYLIGNIDEFDKHKGYTRSIAGKDIFIYFLEHSVFAIDDCCSHERLPLSDGFVNEGTNTITCTHHGAKFDIITGKALSLPATRGIKLYKVNMKDHKLYIEID